jgi:hypothetical protein
MWRRATRRGGAEERTIGRLLETEVEVLTERWRWQYNHVYREFVIDAALRQEQGRREAEKLDRFARRLMVWDGVSEDLPEISPLHRPHLFGWRAPRCLGVA